MKKLISAYAIEKTGTAYIDVSGFDVPKLPLGSVRQEKIDFLDAFKKQVMRGISFWKFEDNVITVKTDIHEDIELVINIVNEVAMKVLAPYYEMKFGQHGLPKGFDFGVVVWGTKKKAEKKKTVGDEIYYVDYDEDTGDWCVFDSDVEPHKAVSSWSDKSDAQRDADERNELEMPETKKSIEARMKRQRAARRARLKAEKSGEQIDMQEAKITKSPIEKLVDKLEYEGVPALTKIADQLKSGTDLTPAEIESQLRKELGSNEAFKWAKLASNILFPKQKAVPGTHGRMLPRQKMESKNSITRNRLQQLIKEEYNKLNEEIDSTGIRTVVNSASKLLDAIANFEKDLPPKSVEATVMHTSELKKSLEDMVSNPASYLVKPVKMVSLRAVKEGRAKHPWDYYESELFSKAPKAEEPHGQQPTKIDIIGNDPGKLEEVEPIAYKALPSSYKNDRALTFYYDNGTLCAEHDLDGDHYKWNGKKWSKMA